MSERRLFLDHIETPIGRFAIVADERGRLRAAGFTEGHPRMERWLARRGDVTFVPASDPGGLCASIAAYFEGDVAAIEGLPVAPEGTPFQHVVWRALGSIPCGETRSYRDVARAIDRPAAVRAVGLANGQNPICVVVPCHRVIGATGALTGYGGGIERKRWLLEHERRCAPRAAARAG